MPKQKKSVYLHPQERDELFLLYAQMAESVDALVSNTSGFTSIPVRPRVWVQMSGCNLLIYSHLFFVG